MINNFLVDILIFAMILVIIMLIGFFLSAIFMLLFSGAKLLYFNLFKKENNDVSKNND